MKRILFVDDEPRILQGLRRMLRPMRKSWEMGFVDSGGKALAVLDKTTVDVIVSDMLMPEMSGIELLKAVKEKHPDTIRIVLSGQSEDESILKTVDFIHQFLPKPCEADTLQNAVHRAFQLREQFESDELKKIVSQMDSLPSMPTVYQELMRELESPGSAIKKVGEIIAKDVGLTAKVLKLVNSAYFGVRRQVSSPAQAVKLLGLDTVKALALSAEVFSQFENINIKGFSFDDLWEHSLFVGSLARRIAFHEKTDASIIEHSLIAGLLHDVGQMIFAMKIPGQYQQVLETAKEEKIPLYVAEDKVLGTNHADIGGYLLGLWQLPDSIVEAISFHHAPRMLSLSQFSALAAVHFSDGIANHLNAAKPKIPKPSVDKSYLERLQVESHFSTWQKIAVELSR